MITLHINSKWRVVITSSRLKIVRIGIINVSTMPKPENTAPATK